MELQLHETDGVRGARHLASCPVIVVVGRGPSLGAADYAALTIKETAAIPAEAMSGGAFRHGPLELTESDLGFVVLAPAGATADLGAGIAREVAALGRPTWLLADAARTSRSDDPGRPAGDRGPRPSRAPRPARLRRAPPGGRGRAGTVRRPPCRRDRRGDQGDGP